MIATTNVNAGLWRTFCQEFSRQHHGWLMTITMVETELWDHAPIQARTECRVLLLNEPLREMRLIGHGPELEVIAGEHDPPIVLHIGDAQRIQMETEEAGEHAGLRIDVTGDKTLLLRFRAPALPEELDGDIGEPGGLT